MWTIRRKTLEFVKTSRTLEEERRNRNYSIHLSDLESTDGLVEIEKSMLKELLTNGVNIYTCQFNSEGLVESLTFGALEDAFEHIHFPCLNELWTPCNKYSIDFISKHQLSLRFLNLRGSKLDKIPNLSGLVNLIRLDISHSGIKSFNNFGNLPHLQHLDLNNNNIESLGGIGSLSSYKTLKKINLIQNQISDINGFELLSCMKNLQTIDLSYNNLSRLKITVKIPKLVSLSLSNNKIKVIEAVKNLPNLQILNIPHNYLTKFPLEVFQNLPSLERIVINGNPINSISGLENFPNSLKIIRFSLENFSKSELESFNSYINSVGWKFNYSEGVVYKSLEFIINNYLTLRLENNKVNLYVNDEIFEQCKPLLFNILKNEIYSFDNIDSIDELSEAYKAGDSQLASINIPIKDQFWGHASNLQTWVENSYNTKLLHRNIAFPLLKKLTEVGDTTAKKVFKEEIAKRYANGFTSVVKYLEMEGYLDYLTKDELKSIQ